MAKFEISHKKTALNEGGYVNDPHDKGGETAFGISRKYNPYWKGWFFIDSLKKRIKNPSLLKQSIDNNEELKMFANELYKQKYFTPLRLQQVEQEIANELYDSSVNLGTTAAGTSFQKALNILNRNGKDYPDIKVDGDIGKYTISAYDDYISTIRFSTRNKQKLVGWLIKWINFFQMEVYYKAYGTGQEKFIPGWTERV